jgi:HEAT repeat protein
VAARVLCLSGTGTESDRVAAAKWFFRHAADAPVLDAFPTLERVVEGNDPVEVRRWAVVAAGRVAAAHRRRCPAVVFDALRDPDLSPFAGLALKWFKPLPPEEVRELIRYATSEKPRHREDGVMMLSTCAAHSPEAVKVIRAATDDPNAWVRHKAHMALFRVTDKVAISCRTCSFGTKRRRSSRNPRPIPLRTKRPTDSGGRWRRSGSLTCSKTGWKTGPRMSGIHCWRC